MTSNHSHTKSISSKNRGEESIFTRNTSANLNKQQDGKPLRNFSANINKKNAEKQSVLFTDQHQLLQDSNFDEKSEDDRIDEMIADSKLEKTEMQSKRAKSSFVHGKTIKKSVLTHFNYIFQKLEFNG